MYSLRLPRSSSGHRVHRLYRSAARLAAVVEERLDRSSDLRSPTQSAGLRKVVAIEAVPRDVDRDVLPTAMLEEDQIAQRPAARAGTIEVTECTGNGDTIVELCGSGR